MRDTLQKIESELFAANNTSRQVRERVWMRNILYYMGEQWIEWSKSKKGFEAIYQFDKDDPQPVTNIVLDYVRSVKALILNKDIIYKVWPNSNSYDDIQASDLAECVLRDIDATDGNVIMDENEKAVLWMILTGTGFIRDYPDMGMGKWIGDTGTKTGNVATEALLPFNLFVGDVSGTALRKLPYIGIQGLKPKQWVLDTFPKYEEGLGDEGSDQIDYQRNLMSMVGRVSEWKSQGATSTLASSSADDLILVREIEFAPTKDNPKGRYVVRIGGKTMLDQKRLPIKVSKEGEWFYTVEECVHNITPGCLWGDAGVNALISPQNTINRIDQLAVKNREGVGRATITGPTGFVMKTISRAGSSVNVVEFDPITSGGVAPQVSYGKPLPSQVYTERETQVGAAQDSGGDPKGVLRGKAPGSASGVMVDILRETAEAGHAPDVARVMRTFQRSARKRLVIAQEIFSEQRVLKIKGADGKISVKKFKGADLRGNTDVRLEAASGFSTTNAGKVGALTNLITAGTFNDQMVDPTLRAELLRIMGLSGFSNKVSKDIARADAENTMISNGESDKIYIEVPLLEKDGSPPMMPDGQTPMVNPDGSPIIITPVDDPLFELDDHQAHYTSHREFLISPEWQDLPEEDRVISLAHISAHQKQLQMAQMAAQADAMENEMMMKGQPIEETPQGEIV